MWGFNDIQFASQKRKLNSFKSMGFVVVVSVCQQSIFYSIHQKNKILKTLIKNYK